MYYATTTSFGSTGIKTVDLPFTPVGCRVTVGQKYNTAQNLAHLSYGIGWEFDDVINNQYHSIYQDTTGGKTVSGDDKIISHWERVSGTLTEKVAASLHSFNVDNLKLSVTTADANYQLLIEAWD